MSEQKETGGPAFPVEEIDKYGNPVANHLGMTLRDYTAIHAPPPPTWWMDCYGKDVTDLDAYADLITQWNYVYADSMLEARKK